MTPTTYEYHELADLYPLMNKEEIAELSADIGEHGQREAVVLFEDKILDGRNRYLACQLLEIDCDVDQLRNFHPDGDPLDYVISMNERRRQLTPSQRSMVAAKITKLRQGRPETVNAPTGALNAPEVTQPAAAKKMGVGTRTVQKAKSVLDSGDKETIEAVEDGTMSVTAAAKKVAEPEPEPDDGPPTDELGIEIARSDVAECFARAHLFGEVQADVQRVRKLAKALTDSTAGAYLEQQQIDADLKNVWIAMKFGKPHTVCPLCGKRKNAKCSACKGAGWVPKAVYERMTPEQQHEVSDA